MLAPAVFLHCGLGAGTSSDNRLFIDPNIYRIILFDQVCFLYITFIPILNCVNLHEMQQRHEYFSGPDTF
jgi:hypothetical protein